MDVLNTVVVGVIVAAATLILGRITRSDSNSLRREFDGLRQEFAEFRTEIKAELKATEQRLDRGIDGLQLTVDGMRSDLTRVALAVGVEPRASNG